jgi:hypothetical protein
VAAAAIVCLPPRACAVKTADFENSDADPAATAGPIFFIAGAGLWRGDHARP